MSRRRFLVPALLAFTLAAGIFLASGDRKVASLDAGGAVLEYRQQDLLYTFHLPTGTEALFNLKTDPECLDNILRTNRKEAARVRLRLEQKLRVESLEELRDQDNPVLLSLRGLGYI